MSDQGGTGRTGHDGSTGAILAAFIANVGVGLLKLVGFVLTGSSALLAESIHSVADSSNQGLLVLGARRARRRPTELHPFGYGRARYFWAFVVGLVLFSLGGLFSLYEGYHKVSNPHAISSPGVALGILVIAMVFEATALRTAIRHAQPHRRGRSWLAFIRSSRSPELPALLLEDSGALLGLLFAIAGVGLSLITGNPVFDGLGTIAIGLLLVGSGMTLAVEMSSSLLGEAAPADVIRNIEAQIAAAPEVRGVIHMLTQHLGPEDLLVAAKVEFATDLSMPELARAINGCERRVRAAVPNARLIYLEPDLRGPDPAVVANAASGSRGFAERESPPPPPSSCSRVHASSGARRNPLGPDTWLTVDPTLSTARPSSTSNAS